MDQAYQKADGTSFLRSRIEDTYAKGEIESAITLAKQIDTLQMKQLATYKDEQSKREAI